ncbi:MAG TPA: VWA domain-containing protein [Leeuwenhoekiella sp.]|nr:VWA domain-containing protein [Leeuwenhoekiella sp.]
MATQTILLIILAGIIALFVSLLQYFYKGTGYRKRNLLFSTLRFLSLFALLLLLIDPQIESTTYTTVKPVLAVAVDNSASIDYLDEKQQVEQTVHEIQENTALNERFDIDFYQFGTDLATLDSLSFNDSRSNIANPLKTFSSVYKTSYVPLLITDGNATLGTDYEYFSASQKQPVYFLAVGDTTIYEDVKIDRINVNRYAYLNNKFPVEIIASYSGDTEKTNQLEVFSGERKVYSRQLQFSEAENGKVVNFYLPADAVGIKQYTVRLTPLENEKNTVNNTKNFGVEVIDQQAKVAIVYSYLHPDLGALKKAITSNKLRDVEVMDISDFQATDIPDYDLLILFEPNRGFAKLYNKLEQLNKNRLTIIATESDFNMLNAAQGTFKKSNTRQIDEVRPRLNTNFSAFLLEDIGYADFPPLNSAFGSVTINGDTDVLLYKNIGGVSTQDPLLEVTEIRGRREVLLLGTGIWKWRAQSFIENQSFEKFDNFIDKLVQYAISTDKKDRLRLDFESFYYGSQGVVISAQYVDDNYNFDNRASLSITVRNTETNKTTQVPMVLKANFYEANLNMLSSGTYDFTVKVAGEQTSASGTFTIIPYDMERQAQNAAWDKLKRTAIASDGATTTLSNRNSLINKLLKDDRYIPSQQSAEKTVSLIDFKFLLFIIVASLAIEWFTRKYNGLI